MELLQKLYKISSHSGHEKAMQKFIMDYCKENITELTIVKDKIGNIYVTKGEDKTYPCVVAHMDEVHKKNKDKEIIAHNNVLLGIDCKAMKQTGIGADDKNGIWVALNLLKTEKVLKCAFFVGEEVGCVGSHQADMTFFDNVRFVLQCDRKNGGDFITNASGVELCDKDFFERCEAAKFGYKVTNGLQTDVVTLKEKGLKVCAVNMSCGYYNPHQDSEMTRFDELKNCLALCEHIIKTLTEVQPHTYERRNAFGGGFLNGFGGWDIPDHLDWRERSKRIKKVAELEIRDDYSHLINLCPDEDVRLYLKRKYQFLDDSFFIDECIDAYSDNEQKL